jgi:hypothetical protein
MSHRTMKGSQRSGLGGQTPDAMLSEVRRLRDIARRLRLLTEQALHGHMPPGNPWRALLCEQDEQFCPEQAPPPRR